MGQSVHVGLIDYGRGNLRSVQNACEALGYEAELISTPDHFEELTHVIFPGQGAFGEGMRCLRELGLVAPLRAWLEGGKPYFGICLGYQLLFEGSEECPEQEGLGILGGRVQRFAEGEAGLKIPHMGWNEVRPTDLSDPLWAGLGTHPYFYFIHSFFPVPTREEVVAARTSYGVEFASAIREGAIFATQFHPEKSQHAGLKLIENFLAR